MTKQGDLGQLLGYCGHLSHLYTDKCLRQDGFDVTPVQTRTLTYLCCHGQQDVNQRDLERELGLKPSTVNGIVSRREEKGYLCRRSSPTDARCRLLSEAGRDKVNTFSSAAEQAAQVSFSVLDGEEQQQLAAFLRRIIENLENEVKRP